MTISDYPVKLEHPAPPCKKKIDIFRLMVEKQFFFYKNLIISLLETSGFRTESLNSRCTGDHSNSSTLFQMKPTSETNIRNQPLESTGSRQGNSLVFIPGRRYPPPV